MVLAGSRTEQQQVVVYEPFSAQRQRDCWGDRGLASVEGPGATELEAQGGEASNSHTLLCFRPWLSRPEKVSQGPQHLCFPTQLTPQPVLSIPAASCMAALAREGAGCRHLPDCGIPRNDPVPLLPPPPRWGCRPLFAGSLPLCLAHSESTRDCGWMGEMSGSLSTGLF